jgi:hypothetical protein
MQWQSVTACYHSLIAAVIERAIADLKGAGPKCQKGETDQAMAFILFGDCEGYCLELGVNYETIRKEAANLYRQIIAKEEKPRTEIYLNSPGRLSGSRHFPVPKMEIIKPHSPPRGSPRSAANSR